MYLPRYHNKVVTLSFQRRSVNRHDITRRRYIFMDILFHLRFNDSYYTQTLNQNILVIFLGRYRNVTSTDISVFPEMNGAYYIYILA